MAFPWIFSDGFESGTTAATATSGSLLDFPHYSELARQGMTPYRGAYCERIRLTGGTTSQFAREDTAFDDWITTQVTRFVRLYFYLGKDLLMADGDKFSLFEAESVLNTTTQFAFGIQRTTGNILFWFNQTQAAALPSTVVIGTTTTALGRWICAEIKGVSAAGTGTIDGYIEDGPMTQITGLTTAAVVDAKIGVIGPDAGTSGTVLIDDFVYDDGQIYRDLMRYRTANAHIYNASDHPLIGAGKFAAAITATGTNGVLTIYDSDGVPNRLEPLAVIRNLTANEFVPGHDIFEVTKGAYTVLSGTGAHAFISIDRACVTSDGAMITQGLAKGAPRT